MDCDFRITLRRYGPTAHLTPTGELGLEAGPEFDRLRDVLDGVDVVACDMGHVTFMDMAGLNCLLGLGGYAETQGIALFVYNWRRQPARLLELVDELDHAPDGHRCAGRWAASRALRHSLRDRITAGRTLGAARTLGTGGAAGEGRCPGSPVSPPPRACRPSLRGHAGHENRQP
ncbi:STAS domain-containing protein [Streptomyces sp. W1SF4]|uniref:STAS domain-containing protein n=1 Tax=Streptomyces sp. W1SF4 TaxID=2305220 RepID=UPI000F70B367|nr:STAS domain-containing protein [Streptomyces sp. W1SF4]AZM87533.1 STAS domain-containing protein [Streptomyces sp. W1SF4]